MYNKLTERPKSRKNVHSNRPSTRHRNAQQAQKCFEIAKEHQKRKQYELAIKMYNQALRNDSDHYRTYCNLGVIYRQKGNYHQAMAKYHRALLLKNDDYKTLYNLANLYRVIGYTDKAFKTYIAILKACSENNLDPSLEIDTNNNVGICYKNIGQYEQAIKCYDRVSVLSPLDEAGYFNKAYCYILLIKSMRSNFDMTKNQRIRQAELLLNKALELNPKNTMTKVLLIQLVYMKDPSVQKIKQSINQLQKLMNDDISASDTNKFEINKKIGEYKALIANIVQPKKDKPKVQPIKDAIPQQSNNKQQKQQIVQHIKYNQQQKNSQENNSKGKEEVQKVKPQLKQQKIQIKKRVQQSKSKTSEQNEKHFLAVKNNAESLMRDQKYQQALQLLKNLQFSKSLAQFQIVLLSKAAQFYGDKSYAQTAVSNFYYAIKKNVNQKRETIPISPQDTTVEVFNAVGDCLTILNLHSPAIRFYQISSELCEKNKLQSKDKHLAAQSGLGYNHQKLNHAQEAEACFRKSIQIDPNNSIAHLDLAGCLHQNQKITEALQYYSRFLELANPTTEKIYIDNCLNNMAICYKSLKNKEKELQTLERLMASYDSHYETVEQILQNYKPQELIKVYEQLAIIYQQILSQGPSKQTMEQIANKLLLVYKVMIELNNENYETFLDLGGCLHELNRHQEAIPYYQKFIDKANPKIQWFEINNCLSNMAVCFKVIGDSEEQLKTLQKLMESYDLHYQSLSDLFKHYDPNQLIKVYIQLARLYQREYQQKLEEVIEGKLVVVYEIMLQFDNLENRMEINEKIEKIKAKKVKNGE